MTTNTLGRLATAVGLCSRWTDAAGKAHRVPSETLRRVLHQMGLPCDDRSQIAESRRLLEQHKLDVARRFMTAEINVPIALPAGVVQPGTARLTLEHGTGRDVPVVATAGGGCRVDAIAESGYHRLELNDGVLTIAVAPPQAYGLAHMTPSRRVWGLAAQLYGLNERLQGGFGDFGDLERFAEAAAHQGADAVAISPVHALFTADPTRYSPYAPSSRIFLNPLYADPVLALGEEMEALSVAPPTGRVQHDDGLIDWPEQSHVKIAWFTKLYDAFLIKASPALRADFESFRRDGGALLEEHGRFEALHAHFKINRDADGWQDWPAEFQDPASPAVAAFASEHTREIGFHIFLQWLAHLGLAAAQRRAKDAGMAIGLIADLAIGTHPGGSHAWSRRRDLLTGLSVGAPPDLFNTHGQDWGLAAFSPMALASSGFAPFLATLRAALRYAGGIRIDHILGLTRLWLVPQGNSPKQGVYLTYPVRDFLRLLALESHRHQAIVIGEDLGTVPEGFRDELSKAGIMGMNVLMFERDKSGAFIPPADWSADRVALTTTHDLPTIAGWWCGRDIEWLEKLGLSGSPRESARRRKTRKADRSSLWAACVAAGTADGDSVPPEDPAAVVDGAVEFVAKTHCELALLPVEDVFGLEEQPNLPGTVDEHPNWRRRLPADAATLFAKPDIADRLEKLRRARKDSA